MESWYGLYRARYRQLIDIFCSGMCVAMQVGKDGRWVTGPEALAKKPIKGIQSFSKSA